MVRTAVKRKAVFGIQRRKLARDSNADLLQPRTNVSMPVPREPVNGTLAVKSARKLVYK
jgi:hypothetical protein